MNSFPLTNLPTNSFSQIFNHTTNSYKFYWLLAIIEELNNSNFRKNALPTKILIARMIAKIWYPINHHNLSFGKQDKLGETVEFIRENSDISINDSEEVVFQFLKDEFNSPKNKFKKILKSLQRYVPFRFLTPWFKSELQGVEPKEKKLGELAKSHFNNPKKLPFYKFSNLKEQTIEINSTWSKYLKFNHKILTDFCYWNLTNYLQTKNPNSPNIAFKLFGPQKRDLSKAKLFWNLALKLNPSLTCIYSGANLQNGFSIDHFVPWSFVAHDHLWNLIPTIKTVNSQKGNSIPSLKDYLGSFTKFQFTAIETFIANHKEMRLLEDYLILFSSDLNSLSKMSYVNFKAKIEDTIKPLCQIASNSGFPTNWKFK